MNSSNVNASFSMSEAAALAELPEIPRDAAGPVFAEPWQAQVFAITLALYERGLFSWPEWAEHLSRAIGQAQAAGDPDCGDSYYNHWLAALEAILHSKGVASVDQLCQLQQAWSEAAAVTPHGAPIELSSAQRAALAASD
ncbi:MAG: nitrile hydratase accessory protein [Granulosicoccaceae bacterium]